MNGSAAFRLVTRRCGRGWINIGCWSERRLGSWGWCLEVSERVGVSLLCPIGIRWRGHFVEVDTKRIVYRIFDQLKCHGELFVRGVRFFMETREELMNGLVLPGVCRQVVLGLVLPETFGKLRQQQLADSLAGLAGLL